MISIVGAFLLIADYIVTAALSAFSAFSYFAYFSFGHPAAMAAVAILVVGVLNYFGPRHTGGLAFLIAAPTAVVVFGLAIFCLPHLGVALHHLEPLHGGIAKNWKGFVGVVLALSGVEAIANSTGVMKLNPGTSDANPNVSKTSTPAILWVLLEVCIFTALLSLAMHGLDGLTLNNGDVDAPGNPGVRDYALRYMAQVFVTNAFTPLWGKVAAFVVSLVFGLLLLSAVNTAIVALTGITYLMSRDGEMPPQFQKLNEFGVPNLGLILATIIPALLVVAVGDLGGLADLYAVGVVGAIATNLGACSTDKKLRLATWERALMFVTFLIMVAIEISLFVDKPNARIFAGTILLLGLMLRGLAAEHAQRQKKSLAAMGAVTPAAPGASPSGNTTTFMFAEGEATGSPIMCAIRGPGKTLDFAVAEARETKRPLYLLFVRFNPILTEADYKRKWQEDPEAREVFLLAKQKAQGHPVFPCYAVSDSIADTIVDITATMGVSHLMLGAPERSGLAHLLRGNIVREIANSLPEDIHLLVYA
jgi:amino acid transporter/nucleotide-binding universal stress UspA family protein